MTNILLHFGIPADARVQQLGSGYIHQTYHVLTRPAYVLQRVNKNVFKQPELIASNLRKASDYLSLNYPNYPFLRPVTAEDGKDMVYDKEGFPWRVFPFTENTSAINQVDNAPQAFSAAAAFGRLTRYLDRIDISQFSETIPRFHDLALRYQQFEAALAGVEPSRKKDAVDLIERCVSHRPLVDEYTSLIQQGALRLRITHNDTKINNVLFDQASGEAVMVIDLDTLMPGYFIYDLGDMVRTFVSPVSEEEKDFSKIHFRKEIHKALLEGYMSEMSEVMSEAERRAIPFAGKMMTYIMALRFLADFLRGDMYYHTTYPGQNLVRAGNQLRFLELGLGD